MDPEEDAYGRAMLDHYGGDGAFELVERDDGWFGPSADVASYFAPFPEWPERQREAMARVEGRVLDVGCGAGRAMAHLERQGHDCLGVDVSPGAVEVCRRRGLDARELDVADVDQLDARLASDASETSSEERSESDGEFDTLLMLGNNFGLVGGGTRPEGASRDERAGRKPRERAPEVLGALASVAAEESVLLAESRDPRETDEAAHLDYHQFNRERGRLPGALRIRVRYGKRATPWFDYLLASPDEMREIVTDTPWRVEEVLGDPGSDYVAVLRTRT